MYYNARLIRVLLHTRVIILRPDILEEKYTFLRIRWIIDILKKKYHRINDFLYLDSAYKILQRGTLIGKMSSHSYTKAINRNT
jgi:hypothetical protein